MKTDCMIKDFLTPNTDINSREHKLRENLIDIGIERLKRTDLYSGTKTLKECLDNPEKVTIEEVYVLMDIFKLLFPEYADVKKDETK